MTTQNWRQPAPPQLVAINVDPADATEELRGRTSSLEADAATAAAALARRRSTRAGAASLGRPGRAAGERARARRRAEHRRRARVPRRLRAPPCPTTPTVVCRHVHPGLLARRLPPRARAAAAAVPDGLGHAGLRVPGGARARRCAAAGPVVAVSRRRRLPVRLRRARHGGAGAPPAHRRSSSTTAATGCCASTSDRAGDRAARRRPATRRTSSRSRARFGVRAEAVDGLGDAFAAALAAPRRRLPSPPCSSRAPRCSRRRRPRRAGTGTRASPPGREARGRPRAPACPSGPSAACRRSPSSAPASG